MAFIYDMLPPVIPDFIPPFTGTDFQIPITMYNSYNQDSLKNFGINTVQISIISQKNDITNSYNDLKNGDEIYRDKNNPNIYILKLKTSYSNFSMNENEFYKLQIRFSSQTKAEIKNSGINNQCFTEWSSICLIKKIIEPSLEIRFGGIKLQKSSTTIVPHSFLTLSGVLDSYIETLKSYQIIIKDITDSVSIKLKTDWLTPKSRNIFTYIFNKRVLEPNKKYKIYVNYSTLSGYTNLTQHYFYINTITGIVDNISFYFQTHPSEDTGDIKIRIFGEQSLKQNFLIQRSSSENNFSTWENLSIIQFDGAVLDGSLQPVKIYNSKKMDIENLVTTSLQQPLQLKMYEWSDKTIKSGIFYKYAVAPIYKLVNSITKSRSSIEQAISDDILITGNYQQNKQAYTCIFEDMFLTGNGGQNLRIKYNPTVSNFKYNIQESIQNTLGSIYPYITRNGKQKYRSFSIGGLITLFMDINDRWNVPSYFDDSNVKMDNYFSTKTTNDDIIIEPIIITIPNQQYQTLSTVFSGQNINNTEQLSTYLPGPEELLNRYSNQELQVISAQSLFENKDIQTELKHIATQQQYNKIKKQVYSSAYNDREAAREVLYKIYIKLANVYNQIYIGEFAIPEDFFSDIQIEARSQYNKSKNINKFNDIIYEREFRQAVYKFLYDPTPKLFRSNAEGNILIKLTNLSFTPLNELGRQLYSFSAQAIEIDECSIVNFNKYNIYNYGEWKNLNEQYTYNFKVSTKWMNKDYNLLNDIPNSIETNSNIFTNGQKARILKINNFKINVSSTAYVPLVDLQTIEYVNISDINETNLYTKTNEKSVLQTKYARGWIVKLTTNDNGIKNFKRVFINKTQELNFPSSTVIESAIVLRAPSYLNDSAEANNTEFTFSGMAIYIKSQEGPTIYQTNNNAPSIQTFKMLVPENGNVIYQKTVQQNKTILIQLLCSNLANQRQTILTYNKESNSFFYPITLTGISTKRKANIVINNQSYNIQNTTFNYTMLLDDMSEMETFSKVIFTNNTNDDNTPIQFLDDGSPIQFSINIIITSFNFIKTEYI